MQTFTTADGSKTLYNATIGEHYHSVHGAFQESKHVFLKSGLQFLLERKTLDEVSILEVGFGTGLNFILTADYCNEHNIKLDYVGIEAYPLKKETIESMGYEAYVSSSIWSSLMEHYEESFDQKINLSAHIQLKIDKVKLQEFRHRKQFDVIYFDAFAAIHQPEMWTTEHLAIVCEALKTNGVFVTYAITGNLKRTMKSLGFEIEKARGAPGKREMLRAVKL